MMKRRICFFLALVMVLSFVPVVPSSAAEPWQDAYAEFLGETICMFYDEYIFGEPSTFQIYDIDNNGIPELFFFVRHEFYIVGINGDVLVTPMDMGTSSYGHCLSVPADTSLSGILWIGLNRSTSIKYITLQNGKIDMVSCYVEQGGVGEADYIEFGEGFTQEMFNAYENVSLFEVESYRPDYFNIADIVYGYNTPASTNPHPYATALREFYKEIDDEYDTRAFIVDMDDVGLVMLAVKYIKGTDMSYGRFYYIQDGTLHTFNGVGCGAYVFLNRKNLLKPKIRQ